jgi:hypothetical protein
MMRPLGALLLFMMLADGALATKAKMKITLNPIRRVVNMLMGMQKKIASEGKRDQEMFDEFMCYCKTGGGDLQAAIDKNSEAVPQLQSTLEQGRAKSAQLKNELVKHKETSEDAQASLDEAKGLRKKEAASYAKESAEAQANIAAMTKAVKAIKKSATGFLQTGEAQIMKRLSVQMELSTNDRDVLTAFLTNENNSEDTTYAPQSGEIVGILDQMKATMAKELEEAAAAEEKAIADFQALSAAKEDELASNQKAIEKKTARLGDTGVEIVQTEEAFKDAEKSLAEDTQFINNLKKNCGTKGQEYEKVKAMRAEEMLAIAETVKILNEDDALDLFKKTIPTASLIQTVSPKEVKHAALRALREAKKHGSKDPRIDLISLALRSKKVSFDKLLKMVDEMVALLQKEQVTDDEKKSYCVETIEKTVSEKKQLGTEISDIKKEMNSAKSQIGKLSEEIKELIAGIKGLDKSVAEATATRKTEHEEFKKIQAADNSAKELLKMAKNRLHKFYNPKLYKAGDDADNQAKPSLVQVVHDDDDDDDDEGVDDPMSFLQLARGVPPPPPEAVEAYSKKGQASNSVVNMLDTIMADLDKGTQEMGVEEKDSQADYEVYMKDAKEKRATDSRTISAKEGAKAGAEQRVDLKKLEKKSKLKEEYSTAKKLKDIHLECDWLLSNFDARKKARAGEVEALRNTKAVLSGADYGFLQLSQTRHSRHLRSLQLH